MNKKYFLIPGGILILILGVIILLYSSEELPTSANLIASRQLPESAENYVTLSEAFLKKYPEVKLLLEEEMNGSSLLENPDGSSQLLQKGVSSIQEISLEEAYSLESDLNEISKIKGKQKNSFLVSFQDSFFSIGINYCAPTCGPYL